MPADTKYDELKSLKIERPDRGDRPPKWSKRFILIGISLLAVVAVITMVYRVLSPAAM